MHGLEAHVFPNKYINKKFCVLNMFPSNAYVRRRCKKPKLINRYEVFFIRTCITYSSRVDCVTCTMKSWWCIGASSVDTWFWGTLFYCKKGNIHVTRNTSINTINVCRIELKNSEYDMETIFLLGRHRSLGVLKYWDGQSICPSNITFVWLFCGSNWSIFRTQRWF